ncbi:MAG: NAD(P)/FAD-dependent oxidoreductase [Verrucomicrobia bacterium]|nr:NAD(P)/FAD-dependent oxidoreductase [Verrucomicrobiota bacterium]
MEGFDVIVLGAGAAGLFCAATAGARGRRVLLLEHHARPGNKILISGGGRCNFTNRDATAAQYVTSGSPHFVKSALARFGPADFLALVERHGIAWHEKKLGQLFCDQSSRQILQLLESECADAGVDLRLNCRDVTVSRAAPATGTGVRTGFDLATSLGAFHAPALVVATGGLSFPKLGATPFGYELARQFGLRVVPPRPGLVPLIPGGDMAAELSELAGISLDCETQAGPDTPAFREHLLFTHRGLSGPAILQVSNHLQPGESLRVNLLPDQPALAFLGDRSRGALTVRQALRGLWPDRFLQRWTARHATERPLAQWSRRDLEALAARLGSWTLPIVGDEGYPKAEVTLGGVDTAELSSKTLESRQVPGLHFIGEVVDVTGWLGGYNFQWAWASAHAAGQAV